MDSVLSIIKGIVFKKPVEEVKEPPKEDFLPKSPEYFNSKIEKVRTELIKEDLVIRVQNSLTKEFPSDIPYCRSNPYPHWAYMEVMKKISSRIADEILERNKIENQ